MTRSELQGLSRKRLLDARALYAAGRYSGAYYLAGYAVECALKACVAKQIREFEFPDRTLVNRAYTHDLRELVRVAELGTELRLAQDLAPRLQKNWETVYGWSEQSRYALRSRPECLALLRAIRDTENGVLPWIRQYW